MSVTRPVVKTETLKKNKNAVSPGISLSLESGQLESWYFHLRARDLGDGGTALLKSMATLLMAKIWDNPSKTTQK